MNTKVKKRNIFVAIVIVVLALAGSSVVYSHCQIPCGIYGDDTRFEMMSEHVTTIEKSMKMINQLSSEQKPDMNQLVRWVDNKETHADELSHIVTYYFMAQRVKPIEKADTQEYDKYVEKVTLLHQILVSSMKAKQTTDLDVINDLRELLANFKAAYYEENQHSHEH